MLKDALTKERQEKHKKEAEKLIERIKKENKKGHDSLFLNRLLEKEVIELLEAEGIKVESSSCSARGELVKSTYITW